MCKDELERNVQSCRHNKKKGNSTIVEYAYVPQLWENNGVLLWPKTNVKQERKNAFSKPQSNWSVFKAKIKKSGIIGLEEAELWEDEFVNCSNTDAEDT